MPASSIASKALALRLQQCKIFLRIGVEFESWYHQEFCSHKWSMDTTARPTNPNTSHRRAVLRNLATSLFKHEEISTTYTKAKALRPVAERIVTLAKRGDLHSRRQALSYIMEKSVTHKLFDQMKDRFLDSQGGYIRILKAGHRLGDNAPVAIVQLILKDEAKGSSKSAKKTTKEKKKIVKKQASEKKSSEGAVKDPEEKQEKAEE